MAYLVALVIGFATRGLSAPILDPLATLPGYIAKFRFNRNADERTPALAAALSPFALLFPIEHIAK